MDELKKKMGRKQKFTILTLSLLLAVSLTATIVFAAFTANKTGSVVLSFANGLTMQLDPIDSSAAIHITSAPAAQTGTFSFTSDEFEDLSDTTTVNGIKATLKDQNGYVGYQVEIKEVVSGAETTIAGSWANSNGTVTFTPTGTKTNWRAVLVVNRTNFPTIAVSGQTMSAKSSAALTKDTAYNLFTSITLDGVPAGLMDDLAGRKIKFLFTIKADTAAVVTF